MIITLVFGIPIGIFIYRFLNSDFKEPNNYE